MRTVVSESSVILNYIFFLYFRRRWDCIMYAPMHIVHTDGLNSFYTEKRKLLHMYQVWRFLQYYSLWLLLLLWEVSSWYTYHITTCGKHFVMNLIFQSTQDFTQKHLICFKETLFFISCSYLGTVSWRENYFSLSLCSLHFTAVLKTAYHKNRHEGCKNINICFRSSSYYQQCCNVIHDTSYNSLYYRKQLQNVH